MELSVRYQGKETGALQIEKQGLYYHFDADCGIRPTVPLRLYAVSGWHSRAIGVVSQDGTLHRRFSAHEAEPLPQFAVLGSAEGGFLPWCGEVGGEQIEDGYLKTDGEEALLAMPVSDGGAVPLIAYAAQMQSRVICGRACLVLALQDGAPLPLPEQQFEDEAAAEEDITMPVQNADVPFFPDEPPFITES